MNTNTLVRGVSLASLLLFACAAPLDDQEAAEREHDGGVSVTVQALSGEQKFCRVLTAGNWSDTVVVPDDWEWEDCYAYGLAFSATQFQLGCLTDTTFYKGNLGSISPPSLPAFPGTDPNCMEAW